jgi:hypothetical protein
MRHRLIIAAFLFAAAGGAAAQSLRVVPQEPGPGTLNGPGDCVLVSGPSNSKDKLCPKTKYMKVCGSPGGPGDGRKRTCVNG